jgi:hypothetical protein
VTLAKALKRLQRCGQAGARRAARHGDQHVRNASHGADYYHRLLRSTAGDDGRYASNGLRIFDGSTTEFHDNHCWLLRVIRVIGMPEKRKPTG